MLNKKFFNLLSKGFYANTFCVYENKILVDGDIIAVLEVDFDFPGKVLCGDLGVIQKKCGHAECKFLVDNDNVRIVFPDCYFDLIEFDGFDSNVFLDLPSPVQEVNIESFFINFCSRDANRFVLSYVLCDKEENAIVATDGHRILVKNVELSENCFISSNVLKTFKKFIDKIELCSDDFVLVTFKDFYFVKRAWMCPKERLVFPDWKAVIPEKVGAPVVFEIDKKTIKTLKSLGKDSVIVVESFKDKIVISSSKMFEKIEIHAEYPMSYNYFKVFFNTFYFVDVLNINNRVVMFPGPDGSPFVFQFPKPEKEKIFSLVMPMTGHEENLEKVEKKYKLFDKKELLRYKNKKEKNKVKDEKNTKTKKKKKGKKTTAEWKAYVSYLEGLLEKHGIEFVKQ